MPKQLFLSPPRLHDGTILSSLSLLAHYVISVAVLCFKCTHFIYFVHFLLPSLESYATLVGDVYHGWFEPDTPGFLILRLLVSSILREEMISVSI